MEARDAVARFHVSAHDLFYFVVLFYFFKIKKKSLILYITPFGAL